MKQLDRFPDPWPDGYDPSLDDEMIEQAIDAVCKQRNQTPIELYQSIKGGELSVPVEIWTTLHNMFADE